MGDADCYWCGKPVDLSSGQGVLLNIAPHAASGGSFRLCHPKCLPTKMIEVPNPDRPPPATKDTR